MILSSGEVRNRLETSCPESKYPYQVRGLGKYNKPKEK